MLHKLKHVPQVRRRFSTRQMCIATRDIMDGMFEAYLEANLEPDDIPNKTVEPVYVLGRCYNATDDIEAIRQDIRSRLWFTYRKSFAPIRDDDGPTSDRGWGCMLRCGQMVLAQALLCLHLGRDWLWTPDTRDSTYLRILRKFEDNRQAPFSIHQIAQMGVSERKCIGEWFGPNTVAQVLKKLLKYDEWSSLAIHIALDNALVINEIKDLCLTRNPIAIEFNGTPEWKPLLLIVPLRLGLNDFNRIYVNGIRKCFQFPQSLGIIGGKPNVALYFIGCVGDEVIYLDPHRTQKSGCVDTKDTEDQFDLDVTYHCKHASRMNIACMDPSVAACFFCRTEVDFNDLCQRIKRELIDKEKQPLFELTYDRPRQWSPQLDAATEAMTITNFTESVPGRNDSSDSDYEII